VIDCAFCGKRLFHSEVRAGYGRNPLRKLRSNVALADAAVIAEKRRLANIGGSLPVTTMLGQKTFHLLILTEGFPTYGGLAGGPGSHRVGLREALEYEYQHYRMRPSVHGVSIDQRGNSDREAAGASSVYRRSGIL